MILILRLVHVGADIAGSPDEFLGKRLKCYLKPGEPIYARDVEPVYLVKKGDKVRFYSKSGAVTIEAIARALDSGALGQILKGGQSGQPSCSFG